MAPVEITVRGSHTVRLAPEQATVYANVAADGPDPQPVFDAVATALADVDRSLESRRHAENGPVTNFVVDQARRPEGLIQPELGLGGGVGWGGGGRWRALMRGG